MKAYSLVSNDCIDHLYHLVMSQLNQEHSEMRLSAFQIASELFSRSHHFRTLLVDNFQEFLDLTVETDSDQPLPPPKEVARKLRSLAIQTVQSWQSSYGTAYKKLALGYHFLKQVDFQDAEARTVAERSRAEERQRKLERIYKERVEAACREMEDSEQEIEATLTEMESCMKLLFPEFGLSDVPGVNSTLPNSRPANHCPSDDEQPCCSRDLRDNRREGAKQVGEGSREEKTSCGTERREDEKEMLEERGEKRNDREGRGKGKMERMFEDDREEERRRDGKENEEEIEKGEEKRKQEEGEEGRSEEEEEELFDEDLFIRNSGLISHSYNLELNLSPGLHLQETEDNEAVVSTVIDLHKLITTKHLPTVQGWVQQLLRRALDLKRSLEAARQKHEELQINYKTRVRRV
ncbi:hypothetical protein INR49_025405, partial [Caranx melampygus]